MKKTPAKKAPAKKKTKLSAEEWKEIAMALARQVNFSIQYLTVRGGGSGMLYNTKTGEPRHWKDDAADALEKVPGLKVDREMMHLMGLGPKQRAKEIAALKKRRAQEAEPK